MTLKFSGTRALLIGGTCTIGLFLAERMIKKGLFPVLTYRNKEGNTCIKEVLEDYDDRYMTIYLDLGDPDSINSLFKRIDNDLDFLVDFAQTGFESLIASANHETVCKYFAQNVSSRFFIIKRAARAMLKKKRGRMVFISSSAAKRANPGQGFYAAAKLASEAIYRNLGLELGSRGITTVSLRPGYVDEGRGKDFINKSGKDVLEKVPIKRAINVKELAETILFFLSDSAAGFNATEISMDGGLAAGK